MEPGGQEDAHGHGRSSESSSSGGGKMADGCFKASGQSSTMRMNGKEIVCLILMPTNHRAEWNGHGGMTYEGLEKPMLSGFVAPKLWAFRIS